jgi:RNA polymerase sigma factor (sigma-70 family)
VPTTARLLQLARSATPDDPTAPADTELLRRYVAERDEQAFAELVRRNGPLVLRACRHILGEAADDAFQATFLLLVRSARRMTRPGSLAGWLHAAAVRIANNARRGEDRRRKREAARRRPTTAPDDLTWREVREVLDTEIAALPESDRLAVVLCCVLELSYEEAARRAGCPVGTLRNRLDRGKERLRRRLARYGLPLAAPVLVVGAPPPVSAALVEVTAKTARSAASGAIPPTLADLVRPAGRLRTALFLAPAVAALVAVGVVLATGYTTTDPQAIESPETANPPTAAAPQTATDRLSDPLPAGAVARLGTRRLFGPDDPSWAAYSPDAKKIATQGWYGVTVCDADTGRQLVERTDYYPVSGATGWRADGTGIAVVRLPDRSFFVSEFTNPNEKLPNPPFKNRGPGRDGPDGLEFLALSPDATRLAAITTPDEKQFTIDILPATPGKRVSELPPVKTLGPFTGPCREIRYTARGVFYLSGSWKEEGDWTVTIVDPDKVATTRTITIPPPAYCVWGFMYSLSPDARLAAIPLRPKTLKKGETATNGHDGTIRVWDLESGKELRSFPFSNRGYGTGHAFTPDGKRLVVSGENPYFQIWDVATGKEVVRSPHLGALYPHREASAVAVRSDGKRFATGRRDGRIDIWDTATAKQLIALDTHRNELAAAAVSPDNRLVATLGHDNAIRVWELADGKPVCTIPAPNPEPNYRARPRTRPAFTPDGRGLLVTSAEVVALVEPATGKALDLPGALRGSKENVGGFSADGKTLVTFAQDTVTLWDWPAGTRRLTITVPLAPRKPGDTNKQPEVVRVDYAVSLSPDGRLLFTNSVREPKDRSGGFQNSNDVWDARTGKHLHRLEKPQAWYPPAGFSPDSQVLYLGGHSLDWPKEGRSRADALTAWDPVAGKLLRRFGEPDPSNQVRTAPEFGRQVQALAVSPDGRLLAVAESAMSSNRLWVYETASGRPLKKLAGHDHEVNDLQFSPDGRRLVSVSADQTGLVWDVTLPALFAGPGKKPTAKELADAWERLARPAPEPGYLGIATLAAAPAEAVALLKEQLRPAAVPTDADLDRVTAQLAAGEFADREKASAQLERFGRHAIAGAKTRLAKAESPEVRERLTKFLTRYDSPNPSPYDLRCVRGVAALEAISTPEAKELLADLAKGKTDDTLTREAAASLRRTGGR